MKGIKYILTLFVCITCIYGYAKKQTMSSALPFDREQQFTYYYYEAMRCYDQGIYDKALACLRLCEAINPTDAGTNDALARLYEALQMKDIAKQHFYSAYISDPKHYYDDYANVLWQNDKKTEAIEVLEKARKENPDDVAVCKMLLSCYASSGSLKKSLKLLAQIEKLEGLTDYCAQSQYQIYLSQKKYKKAIDIANQYLVKTDPDDYRYPMLIASVYEMQKDSAEADKIIAAEQIKHPNNPYVGLHSIDKAIKQKDTVAFRVAILDIMHNDELEYPQKQQLARSYEKQLSALHLVPELAKTLVDEYPFEWRAYADYAAALQMDSNYVEAETAYHTAIDLKPEEPGLWKELFFMLKDADKQELVIREANKQFPNSLMWEYYLMILNIDSIDAALQEADKALSIENPDDSQFLFLIWTTVGDIYTKQLNWEKAFDAYEHAISINPDYLYTLNNYAYVLAVHGNDLRKAERMSQKTITEEPNNPIYLDTYAWILHLQGQDSLAEFYMKKALQYIAEDANASYKTEEYQEHYDAIKNREK